MNRKLLALVALVSCSLASVACGEEAEYRLDGYTTSTEADGRITVTTSVRCMGAGGDDCEAPKQGAYCLSASWSAERPAKAETNVVCASRTLKKDKNDKVTLSVTSLAPVPKESQKDIIVMLLIPSGEEQFDSLTEETNGLQ